MKERFPMRVSELFRQGMSGYVGNFIPLTVGAVVTCGTYAAFGVLALRARDSGNDIRSIVLAVLGLILAGTVALPWYSYALAAARDQRLELTEPWRDPTLFVAQLICAFWFWAAFTLGLRYLYGLPSLLALVFYGFHGYVVADRAAKGGLRALGTSVRLGTGLRVALFGIGVLFIAFNFVALLPVYSGSPAGIALGAAAFTVTASVTLVSGACLYDALRERLEENTGEQ